jgi:hypothetical protein
LQYSPSLYRTAPGSNDLEPRADTNIGLFQYARRQFHHRFRAPYRPTHAAWPNTTRYAQRSALPVQKQDVNGKPQPEGMDAAARSQPQTLAFRHTGASYQTCATLPQGTRDFQSRHQYRSSIHISQTH